MQVVDKLPADVLDEIEAAVYACVSSIMSGKDYFLLILQPRTAACGDSVVSNGVPP